MELQIQSKGLTFSWMLQSSSAVDRQSRFRLPRDSSTRDCLLKASLMDIFRRPNADTPLKAIWVGDLTFTRNRYFCRHLTVSTAQLQPYISRSKQKIKRTMYSPMNRYTICPEGH